MAQYWLKEGTVVGGRYRMETVLGKGGYGITYKGTDTRLGAPVAVKEYFPMFWSARFNPDDPRVQVQQGTESDYCKGLERFLEEARTLAQLSNISGVVRVSDFFEENGTAYLVMEYLDGRNLKQMLDGFGGRIPADVLIPVLSPVIFALQKVHERGLIHRDLSPDNIMMLSDGSVRLIDFGNARDTTDNKSMTLAMKEGFAAPEQYRSKGQGTYTDVYGLCATIYYCLTGKLPPQAMERLMGAAFPKPSELGVQIPAYQEQTIMDGLDLYMQKRIQTMQELWNRLYNAPEAQAEPVPAPRPAPAPAPVPQPGPDPELQKTAPVRRGPFQSEAASTPVQEETTYIPVDDGRWVPAAPAPAPVETVRLRPGITGEEIYALSPKTNCRKCTFPTCRDFCDAVARGKMPLERCPHFTDEAKTALSKPIQPREERDKPVRSKSMPKLRPGVTGLDLFKASPQTNCGRCTFPSCLSFCNIVAKGGISIAMCPHYSQEAKAQLFLPEQESAPAASSAAPADYEVIRPVPIAPDTPLRPSDVIPATRPRPRFQPEAIPSTAPGAQRMAPPVPMPQSRNPFYNSARQALPGEHDQTVERLQQKVAHFQNICAQIFQKIKEW